MSNFSQPGHRSRHNQSYWSGAPYLGFGPSAHGFDGSNRRWNRDAYADWRDRVLENQDPVGGSESIGSGERQIESVYLGLRTTKGLKVAGDDLAAIGQWIEAGWAVLQGDRVVLTPMGWLRLDGLAAALTPVTTSP